VADPERDDPERPDLELVARLERDHRLLWSLCSLILLPKAAGERRGVDRHARELGSTYGSARRVLVGG
jgi:hypothetical protein